MGRRSRIWLGIATAIALGAALIAVPLAAGANKGGTFKGKVQKPSFNVEFKLSKTGRVIKGFRAKVWMSCTGSRNPISHSDFLVVEQKIRVQKSGRFKAEDPPDTPGSYEVKGRVRGDKASGTLRYSRGSASLYVSEFCTTFERTWSATKR